MKLLLIVLLFSVFCWINPSIGQNIPCREKYKECVCQDSTDSRINMDCSGKIVSALKVTLSQKFDVLDLSKNKIKNLTSLSKIDAYELNLEYNSLETISTQSFEYGINSTRKLNFKSNAIRFFDPKAFEHLKSLSYLDLSCNRLETILSFKGITNLETINLRQNQIKSISDCVGQCGLFPISIQEIIISENKIDKIENSSFEGLVNLKRLHLNQNLINYLHEDAFKLEKLEYLDLSDNNLERVNHRYFKDLFNCSINLSKQKLYVKVDSCTFQFKNNLTMNMGFNNFLFDDKNMNCSENSKNVTQISNRYNLDGVFINNMDPCLFSQIRNSIEHGKITILNTTCDCKLIDDFNTCLKNVSFVCDGMKKCELDKRTSNQTTCKSLPFKYCTTKRHLTNEAEIKITEYKLNISKIVLIIAGTFIVIAAIAVVIVAIKCGCAGKKQTVKKDAYKFEIINLAQENKTAIHSSNGYESEYDDLKF